jgi:3-hydroxy-3-methylglutaryl CoA synthase
MTISAGIDDLNLYAGTLAIEFSAIAAARGVAEKKWRPIGFERRSVLPSYEDPVTLAVNAAQPIVQSAGAGAFDTLIVATETGLDFGKPLSSYVHKYLGLSENCRNFEVKHACYGGTAALQMALGRVGSGLSRGKKTLVIMTDVARRNFEESVELTMGSGAVALSVSQNPRVLEIEPHSGCAAREVYDVARPHATLEIYDPVLSLGAYVDLLEIAWRDYQSAAHPAPLEEQFAFLLYHTPFVSLAEIAHEALCEAANAGQSAAFERMVAPSLGFNRQIGNTYGSTLYAALAGLLDANQVAPGARLGLFSYGSGSCAEFFSGLVGEKAASVISSHDIGGHLAARRAITVGDYEAATRAGEKAMSEAEFEPNRADFPGHFEAAYAGKGLLVLENVSRHHRRYDWS